MYGDSRVLELAFNLPPRDDILGKSESSPYGEGPTFQRLARSQMMTGAEEPI
jgi:hypothetical protein